MKKIIMLFLAMTSISVNASFLEDNEALSIYEEGFRNTTFKALDYSVMPWYRTFWDKEDHMKFSYVSKAMDPSSSNSTSEAQLKLVMKSVVDEIYSGESKVVYKYIPGYISNNDTVNCKPYIDAFEIKDEYNCTFNLSSEQLSSLPQRDSQILPSAIYIHEMKKNKVLFHTYSFGVDDVYQECTFEFDETKSNEFSNMICVEVYNT